MKHLLLTLLLVLPITLIAGESDQIAQARLRKFTKSSTVPQQNHDFRDAHGFQISGIDPDQPFSFQKVGKIRKITRIAITLTLFDGNTGPGDIDEDDLTLALDGIDTGLILNGFRDNQNDTQKISGSPINESQLRAALRADGKLHATIIDADPAADINRPNGCDCFNTTLVLTGKTKR